jgi:hypothetical protein
MVEGAIVAGLFVILLACLWAALSYHSTKLRVMERARRDVWPVALGACNGSENPFEEVAKGANDANAPALPNTNVADQYADLDQSALAVSAGHVTTERKQAVTFPGVIGGTTTTMKGRMYLRCNEPKPPETAGQFFKQGFSVLKATAGF